MKIGGPEGSGGGQSFFSGAREKMRGLAQFPESTEPTAEDQLVADKRDRRENAFAQSDRVHNQEFDQTKVDQYLTNFRNLGKNNSIDQVDKILGNTDVAGKPEMLAAYKLWQHEQAQQELSAAYENTDENVVDMDSYRQKKDDEESVA